LVVLLNLDDTACRLTARRLRAEHICCRILPKDVEASAITALENVKGILLPGGSKGETVEIPHLQELLEANLPVLAMGDAALTLCQQLGGEVCRPAQDDMHLVQVYFTRDPLVENVENGERYFRELRTLSLSEQMSTMADSSVGALGFRMTERSVYGLAFQVEQNDTDGMLLLINFCQQVCGCAPWWSNQSFIDLASDEIGMAVGEKEAICALSGGVDSAVCALLGHRALGSRLHCIFIDTGLLRKGEGDLVEEFFRNQAGLNLVRINAADSFMEALRGVHSQKEKEQIIFSKLQVLMEYIVRQHPDATVMLQGTNYSDMMERPGEKEQDTPLGLTLVAPVRELFKDEIRSVGKELGLPEVIIRRQPFPGSGLALRILGEVTQEKLDLLREADDIFRSAIEESGLSKRLWQYFATISDNPAREDDEPASYLVTLRAVQAVDGAAAMPARLPNDLQERISADILAISPHIRRVLYDLTPSHRYAPIDWR